MPSQAIPNATAGHVGRIALILILYDYGLTGVIHVRAGTEISELTLRTWHQLQL